MWQGILKETKKLGAKEPLIGEISFFICLFGLLVAVVILVFVYLVLFAWF